MSKIADIRDHKAFEKALRREEEAFELAEAEEQQSAEIVQLTESSDKDLSYPSHIELLRKMRQERS